MKIKNAKAGIVSLVILLCCFTNSLNGCTVSTEQAPLLLSTTTIAGRTAAMSVYGMAIDDAGNQYLHLTESTNSQLVKLNSAGQLSWALEMIDTQIGYDNIVLSNDYASVYIMVFDASGMNIIEFSTNAVVRTDYAFFPGRSMVNSDTDLRLSPAGDYLAFTVLTSGTDYEFHLMSLGDFSATSYRTAGSSATHFVREILPLSGTQFLYIYVVLADQKIRFEMQNQTAGTLTFRQTMDCPTSNWQGHRQAATHAGTDTIVIAIGSEGANILQFMNATTGSLIGSQWKMTNDNSFDNNVYAIAYRDQKVYITTASLQSSSNSALIVFDTTTDVFQIFAGDTSGVYYTMTTHPTSGEIYMGKVGDSNGQVITKKFTLDNILVLGTFSTANSALVFTAVTPGTHDLTLGLGPFISPALSFATSSSHLPSILPVGVTIVQAGVYTVNLHPDGDETTMYTDLIGQLYDPVNVACVDGYGSGPTYTVEAYGTGLDGTDLVTGIDSATGQLTISSGSVVGTFTLAVRATYAGTLYRSTLTPITIITELAPVEPVEPVEEKEKEKAWFNLSNDDWGLVVTGIILVGLLIIGFISTLIFCRFIFKWKGKQIAENKENRL